MFVTFINIIVMIPFYQIMDYRDTRAYILDPCIQEFCINTCGMDLNSKFFLTILESENEGRKYIFEII